MVLSGPEILHRSAERHDVPMMRHRSAEFDGVAAAEDLPRAHSAVPVGERLRSKCTVTIVDGPGWSATLSIALS